MNETLIHAWVEREFETVSWPIEMVDKLMPLLARVWDEGRLVGYNETGGDTPNPYGEPTDYALNKAPPPRERAGGGGEA